MINYNIPAVRVARRVLVVALGAFIAVFLTKINLAPDQIVDSILAITKTEWVQFAKVAIGSGILLGIDKLKREIGV
ncbi:MAG: hypothetical protein AAB922_06135 [Patescibacteria group bacterium]